MATWTTVWKVHPNGTELIEFVASSTERNVTVRRPGTTKGGEQWARYAFGQQFADSRLGAIDKWLTMHRSGVEELRRELAKTEAIIARLEELRAKEVSS